jgi:hypothetical protein
VFDLSLFTWIVAVSIPPLLVTVPRQVRRLLPFIMARLAPGQTPPAATTLILLNTLQNLALVTLAAGLGTALASRAGLGAPVFSALAAGQSPWPALRPMLAPALTVGGAGAIVMLIVYYTLVRPRLGPGTRLTVETLRVESGWLSRVGYGGIVEEILARWGLMTTLAWIGVVVIGAATPAVIWAANLGAGVVFGLAHLPPLLAAGEERGRFLWGATVGLNLWVSLVFGWLYWQHGLAAAMLAHGLLHLIWLPTDWWLNTTHKDRGDV